MNSLTPTASASHSTSNRFAPVLCNWDYLTRAEAISMIQAVEAESGNRISQDEAFALLTRSDEVLKDVRTIKHVITDKGVIFTEKGYRLPNPIMDAMKRELFWGDRF